MVRKNVHELLKSEAGIRLDIGCGANPQEGFVGMDYRDLPTVDIIHDVTQFPWPLPDESVLVAIASHLVEHIPPFPVDIRLVKLVQLLINKKVVTKKEVADNLGEVSNYPIFMRFMDEVWRVLKPDGEFAMALPHAESKGQAQDPSHINPCNEITWSYFDPLEPNTSGMLYKIYKPKPWRIKFNAFKSVGTIDVVLVKRREDPSYYEN